MKLIGGSITLVRNCRIIGAMQAVMQIGLKVMYLAGNRSGISC